MYGVFNRVNSALSGIIDAMSIRRLDLTWPRAEENLACDEVLLDLLQEGRGEETLRFWQPDSHFVVLGYGNSLQQNVRLSACRRAGIPILRRCSGGGTVLQGPGCLNYALILRAKPGTPLETIRQTNGHILQRHQQALESLLGRPVRIEGETDLAVGPMKISGNSQRRKKEVLLFHGSILLHLDLELVERLLPLPQRQPAYRRRRSHRRFLQNTHLDPEAVKQALAAAWDCQPARVPPPRERVQALARDRYSILP